MVSIVGIVVGIACSFPMLYILGASINHPGRIGLGPLVACCLVPFAVLQVFMLCINSIAHDVAVEFGISSTGAFLVCVVVIVLLSRPWRR